MVRRKEQVRAKRILCTILVLIMLVSSFSVSVFAAERATGRFTITVEAGTIERGETSFSLDAGEVVTIAAAYTPTKADVDFGLVDEDGIFHYATGKNGSFNKSISISTRGNYTFAIRNNSSYTIEATGYVNY